MLPMRGHIFWVSFYSFFRDPNPSELILFVIGLLASWVLVSHIHFPHSSGLVQPASAWAILCNRQTMGQPIFVMTSFLHRQFHSWATHLWTLDNANPIISLISWFGLDHHVGLVGSPEFGSAVLVCSYRPHNSVTCIHPFRDLERYNEPAHIFLRKQCIGFAWSNPKPTSTSTNNCAFKVHIVPL